MSSVQGQARWSTKSTDDAGLAATGGPSFSIPDSPGGIATGRVYRAAIPTM